MDLETAKKQFLERIMGASYSLAGEAAGNIEGLDLGAGRKPKKKSPLGDKLKAYVDEDETEDDNDPMDDADALERATSGDGKAEQIKQAIAEQIEAAFMLGMMIGKEEPDQVPDLDDEWEAVEHEVDETHDDYAFDDGGEGEAEAEEDEEEDEDEERGYAAPASPKVPGATKGKKAPEGAMRGGLKLMPSKKNPKVRRWQAIKDVVKTAPGRTLRALKSPQLLEGRITHGLQRTLENPTIRKARDIVGAARAATGVASSLAGAGALATPAGLAAVGLAAGGGALASHLGHGLLTLGVRGHNAINNKLYRTISLDPRTKGEYWQDKHKWAIRSITQKTGMSERGAANLLASAYAYHRLSGMATKGSALTRRATGRALGKAEQIAKRKAKRQKKRG